MIFIREVPSSNLAGNDPNWGLSWFSSAPPQECRESVSNLTTTEHYIPILSKLVESGWIRYWATTSKQTTKQHSLRGSRFLLSKYTQPLLGNAFANKCVPMETIGEQQWTVFSTWSEQRCYNRDKFRSWSVVRESVKRRLYWCSWRIHIVRRLIREWLLKTQQTEKT
jgi:hypothetical protein